MPLDEKPADRIPELIRDWSEIAAEVIRDQLGLSPGDARAIGGAVVLGITEAYAGLQFYVPQDYARQLRRRDQELYAAWDGSNWDDLAGRYKLSVTMVRRIIRRCQAHDLATRQVDMFQE